MGLYNYSKPGPGVDKDAPKKKGIFLYFELLGRKISNLASLNMLYFLCSLPMMILYFLIFLLVVPGLFNNIYDMANISEENLVLLEVLLSLFLSLVFTITLGSGPASAAMAYIMREYSKEQHVWLMSTFFSKMKENFKQEMIVALVDLLFSFVATFSFIFYLNQYLQTGSLLWFLMVLVLIVLSFVFISMHYFIHQLIITFENNLKDVYKNAMIFALSTVWQNVLLSAVILGGVYVVFNYLNLYVALIISFVLLISFLRFPVEFFTYNKIKRVTKYETKEEVVF